MESTLPSTGPKVSKESIDALMARVTHVFEAVGTSTFCHAFLDGAFYLATGHSACVCASNFDPVVGQDIAHRDMLAKTISKLWELEGYVLYRAMNTQVAYLDKPLSDLAIDWTASIAVERKQLGLDEPAEVKDFVVPTDATSEGSDHD